MQLNFLQEDLLATLKESKQRATASKKSNPINSVPDLFGGLPLAMPPEKAANKPAKKDKETADKKSTEEENASSELNKKSATAFKTISEASALLNVPQHVLRFWESRFTQVKPLKMGGGRRYYRPEDIDILSKIQNLLYKQGYTIKGAKKAFELKDIKQVAAENIPEIKQNNIVLTDKQRKQVISIRQELLGLRDKLYPFIAEKLST